MGAQSRAPATSVMYEQSRRATTQPGVTAMSDRSPEMDAAVKGSGPAIRASPRVGLVP